MSGGTDGNWHRAGLVGPVVLIGLGALWLLSNLGLLAINLWETLFRLWPLLLIAAGVDILLRRQRGGWTYALRLALVVAILAGGVWLLAPGTSPVRGQPLAGEQIARPLNGATRAHVTLAPAAGQLRLRALRDSRDLVHGTVGLTGSERVLSDFKLEAGAATYSLRTGGALVIPLGWKQGQGRWDLALNPDPALDLEISLGAGELDLDLTGLHLTGLEVSLGVGQTTVTLPASGRFRAAISGAIGQIVVVIPPGMAARIEVNTAIGSRNLPAGYTRDGDAYTSPGFETAENRVELEISQAIGEVIVR